jgi:hypothetical protein
MDMNEKELGSVLDKQGKEGNRRNISTAKPYAKNTIRVSLFKSES